MIIFSEGGSLQQGKQAALCADYSVPVDCVTAGPAPRPSSFHEISAPKSLRLAAACIHSEPAATSQCPP
ncbi:hypothetical protein MSG28_012306 [Choristoneura fumiferana]|uniref:Uncharacterized protein n=1 Tax=Choristoneura fumiferana TaxID=7141 RepID=A0ACC0KCK4_CHOFU|nr:hypothetical protein MSG28_012306 [Choristoneura fumiferana]